MKTVFKRGNTVTLKTGGLPFRVKKVLKDHVEVEWKIRRSKECKGFPHRFHVVRYVLQKSNLRKVGK
jgi:uncharacterized protein YodC (DUF2158 family)